MRTLTWRQWQTRRRRLIHLRDLIACATALGILYVAVLLVA